MRPFAARLDCSGTRACISRISRLVKPGDLQCWFPTQAGMSQRVLDTLVQANHDAVGLTFAKKFSNAARPPLPRLRPSAE